jgi:hypothetical protein
MERSLPQEIHISNMKALPKYGAKDNIEQSFKFLSQTDG